MSIDQNFFVTFAFYGPSNFLASGFFFSLLHFFFQTFYLIPQNNRFSGPNRFGQVNLYWLPHQGRRHSTQLLATLSLSEYQVIGTFHHRFFCWQTTCNTKLYIGTCFFQMNLWGQPCFITKNIPLHFFRFQVHRWDLTWPNNQERVVHVTLALRFNYKFLFIFSILNELICIS